jgi:hypothetical protein
VFGPLDLPILTAILGFFFLLHVVLIVLFHRYRRCFELLFNKFLALDIFAIFSFGSLHTVSVVYLNAITAVLPSGALDGPVAFWLPFGLCLIVALLDLDLKPNLRLPPLLVPESMIIPSKPTIVFCLNSAYVRPGELTLHGLMVTLVGPHNVVTVMGGHGTVGAARPRRAVRQRREAMEEAAALPPPPLLPPLLAVRRIHQRTRYRWNGISWPPAS